MMPFLPGAHRRRAAGNDPHILARQLLAESVDTILDDADAEWLDAHLDGCPECEAVGAEYEEQGALLRSLPTPQPPRDLWARTAAKLELESGGSLGMGATRRSMVPLGALSGALVVAVVVGASLLSQPTVTPMATTSPSAAPPASSAVVTPEPRSTPIPVGAGDVWWVVENDDGSYAISFAPVEQVCASDIASDCAPLDPPATSRLTLAAQPRAIVKSPTEDQLVVVEAGTHSEGGTVYVVPVPSPSPSTSPTPPPSPSSMPSPTPSVEPSPTPTPTPTPPSSVEPSPPGSPAPTPSVEPSIEPSPSPGGDTTGDEPVAIVSDVIVVGESAGYSRDGSWFAFAARPSDGTEGPDIYTWSPGDTSAHPVTTDHRSVFAGWVGGWILGSRVVEPAVGEQAEASPSPAAATAVSFLLDPATGAETVLGSPRTWRPTVDPTGRLVVYWEGSVAAGESGVDWFADEGRLVLARWEPPVTVELPASTAEPSMTPSPEPTPDASASAELSPSALAPSPSAVAPSPSPVARTTAILTSGDVRDWDIQWDETGSRFALWIADPVDADVGSISLHEVDPETGALDPNGPLLSGVPALAGFSIGDGRLAWATPPGQGGEGSRIVVLAWTGEGAGQIESAPDNGSAPLVIIK